MTAAVTYLEHDEDYQENGWTIAIPFDLMSLNGDFVDENGEQFTCGDRRCHEDSLCTGDGFHWVPGLPALRFE